MSIKLDILAIAAHPDDAEISAGGTLLRSIAQGKKVGIVDLTRGEMGTRGSGDLRMVEAANAANVLGLSPLVVNHRSVTASVVFLYVFVIHIFSKPQRKPYFLLAILILLLKISAITPDL